MATERQRRFSLPVWSKDGKIVYCLNSGPKGTEIFKVSVNGTPMAKVASLNELWKPLDLEPTWMALAPDGSPALAANGNSDEIFAYTWDAP